MEELTAIKSKICEQTYNIKRFKSQLERSKKDTNDRIDLLNKERHLINMNLKKEVYNAEKLKAYIQCLENKYSESELLQYIYSLKAENNCLREERVNLCTRVEEMTVALSHAQEELIELKNETHNMSTGFSIESSRPVSPITGGDLLARFRILNDQLLKANKQHEEVLEAYMKSNRQGAGELKTRIGYLETLITNLEEEKLKLEKDICSAT